MTPHAQVRCTASVVLVVLAGLGAMGVGCATHRKSLDPENTLQDPENTLQSQETVDLGAQVAVLAQAVHQGTFAMNSEEALDNAIRTVRKAASTGEVGDADLLTLAHEAAEDAPGIAIEAMVYLADNDAWRGQLMADALDYVAHRKRALAAMFALARAATAAEIESCRTVKASALSVLPPSEYAEVAFYASLASNVAGWAASLASLDEQLRFEQIVLVSGPLGLCKSDDPDAYGFWNPLGRRGLSELTVMYLADPNGLLTRLRDTPLLPLFGDNLPTGSIIPEGEQERAEVEHEMREGLVRQLPASAQALWASIRDH